MRTLPLFRLALGPPRISLHYFLKSPTRRRIVSKDRRKDDASRMTDGQFLLSIAGLLSHSGSQVHSKREADMEIVGTLPLLKFGLYGKR